MRAPKRHPRRVSLRSRSGDSSLLSVMNRIQERDVRILLDLHEHRVLTTNQIVELHFPSYRVGWRRLRILDQMGLIRHFRPPKVRGSAPFHFVLGEPGAFLVAERLDTDLKGIGYRHEDAIRIARNRTLDHTVAANGFFTRLAYACRHEEETALIEWLGERRAGRGWGVRVEPDGVGTVSNGRSRVRFFFELDRGTETHRQLKTKLRRYGEVAVLDDVPKVLLFAFPTERRELEARRSLFQPQLVVATTTLARAMTDSLGTVWHPLEHPFRLSLLELPSAVNSDGQGAGRGPW
jgi:hypothetical protein